MLIVHLGRGQPITVVSDLRLEDNKKKTSGFHSVTPGWRLVTPGLMFLALAFALVVTRSQMLALAAVGALTYCAFLVVAPPLWLAILLLLVTPFQSLITQLLGGFPPAVQEIVACWKEALIGVGLLRVFLRHPNARGVLASNRWVLSWSALLVLVYCTTFLRMPSIPALFSFNLETRFLGVMLFFIFLEMNDRQRITVFRVMLVSIGLLAFYGLVQYYWDYNRLLGLVRDTAGLDATGTRRLYSYSLDALEPAYGAMAATLIVLSGAARIRWQTSLASAALFVPCLALTYTRSAYIGLVAGIVGLALMRRLNTTLTAAFAWVAISAITASVIFSGPSLYHSSLYERLGSIESQTDESSTVHKTSMKRAMEIVSQHPLGIGLGNYGTIEQRFSGRPGDGRLTEDWVLQVAVQNGIVGGVVYVGLTLVILMALYGKRFSRDGARTPVNAAAGSVFAAMAIVGIFIPIWNLTLPAFYSWAVVGMALASTSKVSLVIRTEQMACNLGLDPV